MKALVTLLFLVIAGFSLVRPVSAQFCGSDNSPNNGVDTAIGCLMANDPKQFISQLLGWGISVGGGISFLLIIFAGFQIATAAGDPKRVQAGRELLFAAISGLILIILSIMLLNIIGVTVLGLDKLGFRL